MIMNNIKFTLEIIETSESRETVTLRLTDAEKILQITEIYKKPSRLWTEMRAEYICPDTYMPQYGIIDEFLTSISWVPGAGWIDKVLGLWDKEGFDAKLPVKAIIEFYNSDINIRLNPVLTYNYDECFEDVDPIGDWDATEGELLIPIKDFEDNESLPFGNWISSHSYTGCPDDFAIALHYGKPINIFKNGLWVECTCGELKNKIEDNLLSMGEKLTLNADIAKKFYNDIIKNENCN